MANSKSKVKPPKTSTADVVARAKAMLAQTAAQGSKSFKGSSYDSSSKKYNASQTKAAVAALPSVKVTEPVAQTVDRARAMLSQTQAQGSTPFAGSSFEKTYLAKYPAPTDASQVGTPFPPLNTPALGPDMGNISDAVAGNKGLEAMLALQQKQADERMKMEQQRQQEQKGLLDKFMGSVTSPWQAREQAIKDTGIVPQEYFAQQEKGIKEIESLTNDYNRVVEAKDAQIAATQDKMGSMNFINNQTAQIERNAAPQLNRLSAQINAKAATLQALQGNFAEARSYVNQAVQDATADTKFKYDMMKAVYDLNEDSFARVDSIYADAYKGAMDIAKMQYDEDLAEKQLIGEYMLKYPSAGLTMQDSLEDASRKIGAVSGSGGTFSSEVMNRAMQVINGQAKLSDFTPAVQADVRDAVWSMQMPESFRSARETAQQQSILPSELENQWNSLRMSVAGPGVSAQKQVWEMTTDQQNSFGLNYLYSSGANQTDIEKFLDPTETSFRAWVINEASK